ncbi:DNA polymerase IV [Paeniglutamicibacter terrestris]|uniref:DNA polymerase IV n=1 Tax=Paeniglutamicibacter terrestris TaxID=2723403 RepID=A0ABX1G9G9_9MICC|nr:DNA polymerase IV [Paeniglutamicibacter terrestris]ASN38912.1 DNA polymerase IV [Arthrobacter sp. 7749]NKG22290.1 DNA polymerase IV [Paeniglutamicibacter terrestris]
MVQGKVRAILHVDMDAFFVSVELLTRPELVGKQIIVGHVGERSVVLSASYECRALGVKSAMPMSIATRMAPKAIVIEPTQGLYRTYSARIMEIFREVTPLVEQLSVDEAFLDVTGSMRRLGPPPVIGTMIRKRLRDELGLPASVGIASSKFVAKVASTGAKPDGMLVIQPERTLEYLHTLPVGALWGVGAKTAEVLREMGIGTVAQLAATPENTLSRRLGTTGNHLYALAWGRDDRAVETEREEKSIGAEATFAVDLWDEEALRREILHLGHRVAARLRQANKVAGVVALKLRYSDFSTLSRSRTLPVPSNAAGELVGAVEGLLEKLGARPQAVRLVGIRAEKLTEAGGGMQLSFDPRDDNWRQAEATMDLISSRFPAGALRPASLLERGQKDK